MERPTSSIDLIDWDEEARRLVGHFVPDFEVRIDDLARVDELALRSRDIHPLGLLVPSSLRLSREGFGPEQQGREEGLEHGLRQASREKLERLLRRRFGDLDPLAMTRLAEADLAELDRLFDRAVEAETREAVFADGSN